MELGTEEEESANPQLTKFQKDLLRKAQTKFSFQVMEDISEGAVVEAMRRLQTKKRNKQEASPMVFTGYWREGSTQIYGLRHRDDQEGVITLGIKGGKHEIISMRMSPYERKKFIISLSNMLGFKVYRHGSGYNVYVSKTHRSTNK